MCMCIWGEKWLRRLGRQLRLNARSVNGKSRFQNLSGKAERVCRPTCKPSAEKAETVQDGWPEQLCLPALGSSERPTSVNKVQYNRRRRMASTLGLHMHAHAYMQSWAHLQTQCAPALVSRHVYIQARTQEKTKMINRKNGRNHLHTTANSIMFLRLT